MEVRSRITTTQFAYLRTYYIYPGNEVADFVRDHLANELKNFASFKNGDYVKALEEIYLHIDRMLKTPEGKQKL